LLKDILDKGKTMSNHTKKLSIYKKAVAAFFVTIGLITIPVTGNAQISSPDPWTGSVAGDNFSFASTDTLTNIKKMLNEGDIAGAVRNAKKLVVELEREKRSGKTSKYTYDAYNALCISQTAQKSYGEAIEACNAAIKNSPNRWFAYNSRGSLNYRQGNFADAVRDYRMALDNAPKIESVSTILQHNIKLAESRN